MYQRPCAPNRLQCIFKLAAPITHNIIRVKALHRECRTLRIRHAARETSVYLLESEMRKGSGAHLTRLLLSRGAAARKQSNLSTLIKRSSKSVWRSQERNRIISQRGSGERR